MLRVATDKYSMKDPMPTWLLKNCIDLLAPYIASLFNLSLSSGIVPTSYKDAYVIPRLKKSTLPCGDLSSIETDIESAVSFQATQADRQSPVDRLSVIGRASSRASVSLSQVPFDRDCASQGRHRPH